MISLVNYSHFWTMLEKPAIDTKDVYKKEKNIHDHQCAVTIFFGLQKPAYRAHEKENIAKFGDIYVQCH